MSQFILVVYDISNDKRRTKLHNTLLNFGTPVQYSVFECLLDPKGEAEMRKAINKVIRPQKDHVRYYPLCGNCLPKVETSGNREVLSELPSAIVIG